MSINACGMVDMGSNYCIYILRMGMATNIMDMIGMETQTHKVGMGRNVQK